VRVFKLISTNANGTNTSTHTRFIRECVCVCKQLFALFVESALRITWPTYFICGLISWLANNRQQMQTNYFSIFSNIFHWLISVLCEIQSQTNAYTFHVQLLIYLVYSIQFHIYPFVGCCINQISMWAMSETSLSIAPRWWWNQQHLNWQSYCLSCFQKFSPQLSVNLYTYNLNRLIPQFFST